MTTDDPLAELWTGERLRLRPPRRADHAALERWHLDPRIAWFSEAGPPYPGLVQAKFDDFCDEPTGPHHCRFVITERDADEPIGVTGINGYTLSAPRGMMFISLSADHWGKGYGTEAVELICRYGFDGLGLHRIFLGTFGFNERAAAAYRKVGFVEEGRIRDLWFRAGRWYDDIQMGLLRREWEEGRSDG